MVMKEKVKAHVEQLTHHIKGAFGGAGNRMSIAGIFGTIFGRKKNGHNDLIKRLFELGHSTDQVTNEILALMIGTTVEMSLGMCRRRGW